MRIYRHLTLATTAIVALTACNEALVTDYNTVTGFPHSVGALQSEMTGAFSRQRNDMFGFTASMEGFARNAAYYTPSEERFVTQLTGQTLLDDDNFGAITWNVPFSAIKTADTVFQILPTLTTAAGAPLPKANIEALQGVMETTKAMDYVYVAVSHDTNGVPVGADGTAGVGSGIVPILCARDTWKAIVVMLDSADALFKAAGSSTKFSLPGTTFNLIMPPGYAAAGNTAGAFDTAFVLPLRARARVEYAFAIARGPGGSAPDSLHAGAPDVNQLDSAISDITHSSIYTPSGALTSSMAVAANDLGIFQSYSSAAGDVANPIFTNSGSIFTLEQSAKLIDTLNDQRFLAKFAAAPSLPTSVGAITASSYAYLNNIGLGTPIPIIRNLELQFLLARAYLGTGQMALAAATVDAVRTKVGGLASGLGSVNTGSYTSVRDFLVREQLPTLILDGTGEQISAIRDYGLWLQYLNTWATVPASAGGGSDFHTSMENIPSTERQARSNNFQPVCP